MTKNRRNNGIYSLIIIISARCNNCRIEFEFTRKKWQQKSISDTISELWGNKRYFSPILNILIDPQFYQFTIDIMFQLIKIIIINNKIQNTKPKKNQNRNNNVWWIASIEIMRTKTFGKKSYKVNYSQMIFFNSVFFILYFEWGFIYLQLLISIVWLSVLQTTIDRTHLWMLNIIECLNGNEYMAGCFTFLQIWKIMEKFATK